MSFEEVSFPLLDVCKQSSEDHYAGYCRGNSSSGWGWDYMATKGQNLTLLLPQAIVLSVEPNVSLDLSPIGFLLAYEICDWQAFLIPFHYPRTQPMALPRAGTTVCVWKYLRVRGLW